MEIRQIRYFIAVANELSLSAASRKIHIAQPALTRQIQALEASVGVELLTRTARGVAMTSAGKVFLKEAEKLLVDLDEAKNKAVRTEQGMLGELRVGTTIMLLWVEELSVLLKAFRERYPNVMLKLNTMLSGPQMVALRDDHIDMGVVIFPPDDPQFERLTLYRDHLVFVVPDGSPILIHPPRLLRDLCDYDFVWFDKENSPNYYEQLAQYFYQCDFTPKIVETGNDSMTMLAIVASGVGGTIVPRSTVSESMVGVSILELEDLQALPLDLKLVWKKGTQNPMLDNMIQLAKSQQLGNI
ncbi:MAG: LysR family transcriptional regulator [Vibrio sp.]